jgi:GR25 family glycosyltransferase involved in LPS biosynthesis
MQCFYINLEQARARREQIEHGFQLHRTSDWTLCRFPALDTQYVRQRGIAGRIRDSEKACFASHRELIRSTLRDEHPIFVLEDDALLCGETFTTLDRHVCGEPQGSWDVTFTDVLFPDIPAMLELAGLRREWRRRNHARRHPEFLFIDLARVNFAGATAYLVQGRSKAKLVHWLESADSLDIPYDLFIRKLVHEGHLKARSIFPFITTLSPLAMSSQLQLSHDAAPNLVWNTFRRLMCLERDLGTQQAALAEILQRLCDEESRAVGTIVAAMLSMQHGAEGQIPGQPVG